MTALCGGAASAPRPSAPALAYLSGNALENIVEAAFGLSEAWASLIVFAAAQTIDLSTFCVTDPPALVWPTLLEIEYITTHPWDVGNPQFNNLYTVIQNAAWYTFCQCTTVATPAAPAPPAYPAGAPVINPPNGAVSSGLPCATVTPNFDFPTAALSGFSDISAAFFPTAQTHAASPPFAGGPSTAYLMPTGVNHEVWDFTVVQSGANGVSITWVYYDSGGNILAQQFVGDVHSGSGTFHVTRAAPPTGAVYWLAFASWGNATSDTTYAFTYSYFCGTSTPSTPVTPCCPPDPVLQAKLDALLAGINAILGSLPSSANSYAEATVHAGLTNSGNFALVDAAIAVRVDLTTIPTSYGREFGDPNIYFDVGFLTTAAVEGNYRTIRIESTPRVYILPLLTDAIHFTLAPGVIASVTELVRGP